MDLTQIGEGLDVTTNPTFSLLKTPCVRLEAQILEKLYKGIKDFLSEHHQLDQYQLMSSALANFLFQNVCEERVVIEKYLNDLFIRVDA